MDEHNNRKQTKEQFRRLLKYRGAAYAAGLVVLLAAAAIGRNVLLWQTPLVGAPQTSAPAAVSDRTADRPTASPTLPPLTQTGAPQTTAAEAPVFEDQSPSVETDPAPLRFSVPLSGGIGDGYSMGVPVFSDTMGDYRTHNGVDFKGEPGEAVRAVAAGVVTTVKEDRLYGNTVTVDHGQGYISVISGLADEGLIRSGAKVNVSQVLGSVGTVPAEAGEGPHIHLEIRKNGVLCDPLEVLGLTEAED